MPYDPPLFLVENGQSPTRVADYLAEFIRGAQSSLHIAIYDFRLRDPDLARTVLGALDDRARAGVDVKIAYDHRNAPKFAVGDDPAPHGTHEFLQQRLGATKVQLRAVAAAEATASGPPTEPIAGRTLMHSKFVVRDGGTDRAAVLMGSANFTDDAWAHQDNNVLVLRCPALSGYYERDFDELWTSGDVRGTGKGDCGTVAIDGLDADIAFSPGEGRRIDAEIASVIRGAKQSLHVASMLISSDAIVDALTEVLDDGRVQVRGICDGPQMSAVEKQVSASSDHAAKAEQIERLRRVFVQKRSHPFDPSRPDAIHDFMHNKLVVADDAVLTGSFNFSRSAEGNAENAIVLRDGPLADQYRAYVEELVAKYA